MYTVKATETKPTGKQNAIGPVAKAAGSAFLILKHHHPLLLTVLAFLGAQETKLTGKRNVIGQVARIATSVKVLRPHTLPPYRMTIACHGALAMKQIGKRSASGPVAGLAQNVLHHRQLKHPLLATAASPGAMVTPQTGTLNALGQVVPRAALVPPTPLFRPKARQRTV